jgi:hypothetical protein
MTRPWQPLLAAALALALGACATTQRIEASGDVHALLVAIRDGDGAAFDARVDKVALKRELEARILARTQRPDESDATRALGALLAHPLAQLAGDSLLKPKVFLAVAEYYGYKPDTPIPGEFAIAAALRGLPDGRVCAARRHDGPCLLTFADEAGTWRLVSFDGDISQLRLPQ